MYRWYSNVPFNLDTHLRGSRSSNMRIWLWTYIYIYIYIFAAMPPQGHVEVRVFFWRLQRGDVFASSLECDGDRVGYQVLLLTGTATSWFLLSSRNCGISRKNRPWPNFCYVDVDLELSFEILNLRHRRLEGEVQSTRLVKAIIFEFGMIFDRSFRYLGCYHYFFWKAFCKKKHISNWTKTLFHSIFCFWNLCGQNFGSNHRGGFGKEKGRRKKPCLAGVFLGVRSLSCSAEKPWG